MANTFEKLSFTKDWNNSADFPTYEENEAKVRADLQALHDETKNFINDKLIPGIENLAVPGSGDMLESIYDPQRKRTDVYQYADNVLSAVPEWAMQSAKPTASELGAAPAGYGLGEVVESVFTTIAQVDAFKVGGVRVVHLTDGNNIGASTDGKLVCVATARTYTQTFSFYYALYGGLVELKRVCTDSVDWQPWEWVNPPMYLDAEYRTTERYLGKPVYVKLVDGGALPNNTLKYVAFIPNEELEFIVEYVPYTLGKPIMPYSPASGSTNGVWFDTSNSATHRVIKVTTNYDASANNFSVLMKYTKTTD